MLVKCICTNCAGHLEFEEENAGESIACPHCGFDTTLTLPGTEEHAAELLATLRKLALRRRVIWSAAAVLVLAAFGYVLYHWGVPWIQDLVPEIESTVMAVVVLILLCLMLPFAILWLIFPVLLFFQLRRLIQLLVEIAESSAAAQSEAAAVDFAPAVIQEENDTEK